MANWQFPLTPLPSHPRAWQHTPSPVTAPQGDGTFDDKGEDMMGWNTVHWEYQ
jgi:hypothetical protein